MIGAEDELEGLTLEERVNVAFYESCHRSVIHIETRGDSESFLGRITSTEGSGSGSVWDSEGHILTNYHVIKGAQLLTVTLQDGSQFEARLAGNDITNDIAVLKIERENASLWPVTPGPSKKLRVGQRVFALGSSLGLEQTISVGSVNRTIPSLSKRMMKSIIQIDTKPPKESLGITLLWARLDRWAVYSQRFKQGLGCAMECGEHLGIGIYSTVLIPKGYKPLAGGWSAATTPGGELHDSFSGGIRSSRPPANGQW